ncbi:MULTISPECIES: MFS transporter [unclassified Streptomyces]|uniref:MFS transporter n=1 Tax=unclassified Streptomyces TaxID=2593676 RepID=UPI0029B53D51|nr:MULTISPECIES: MFS transporter [unclassified Streptomyces]MDX3820762.1 MFS transporter [Streptomyces sp. AK08-01A]
MLHERVNPGPHPAREQMTVSMKSALRRAQAGTVLIAFGTGFTGPFLFVYVAHVRRLGDTVAGVTSACFAVAALCLLPLIGRAIDRRGPARVLAAGAFTTALGALLFGHMNSAIGVIAASAMMGAGVSAIQPSNATLVMLASTPQTRARAFATQAFIINLGLGAGGLVGGASVDLARPETFTTLFTAEAILYFALSLLTATIRAEAVTSESSLRRENPSRDGLKIVFADRAMLYLCILGGVIFFAGYGQISSGLPAYATESAQVRPLTLGIAEAANTGVIVIAQFLVLRRVSRMRRSRAIQWTGIFWTMAWLTAGLAGIFHASEVTATTLIVVAYGTFGFGETLLSPTLSPIIADLAPEDRIGTYNSSFALVKQVSLAAGPAVAGLIVSTGYYGAYIAFLSSCSICIVYIAKKLKQHLAPAHDNPQEEPQNA